MACAAVCDLTFKSVNDTYGHDAGDRALQAAAEVLRSLPRGRHGGRVGGDEFALILPRLSEPADARWWPIA
jgi:diguanylate cyclase (GGDEF)-like protein